MIRPNDIFNTLLENGTLKKGRALDLGAGKGKDSTLYQDSGFDVTTVDKDLEKVKILKEKGLTVFDFNIEDFPIQKGFFDLINASFVLQFLSKEKAKDAIERAILGLKPDGILLFNVIGTEDEWKNNGKWSFWTAKELEDFLKEFPVDVISLKEEKIIGPTQIGKDKLWHTITVALKRA